MKKMKLAVMFAALVSALTFSSCLNGDGGPSGPAFGNVLVTVTGDELLGYKLYSDYGPILIPTSQSVAQLPGLKKIKRAIVAFDLVGDQDISVLEPGKSYNVVLNPNYCGGIPTSTVIDTYQNEAADTLFKNQDPISSFEGLYAVNGYANVSISVPYDRTKMFYMNAGYDSDLDVNSSTNTLSLTVYYDNNSSNAYEIGNSIFSFKLPAQEYGKFEGDSINLILKAKTTSSGDKVEELKCRIHKSELFPPRDY